MTFFVILSLLMISPSSASAAADCTGGIITYSGGNIVHTFTSSGTLDCTGTTSRNISVLVVAGGGGGGAARSGGGGGAGGVVYNSSLGITATSYSVTVGAGGAGGVRNSSIGVNGSDSIFDSITAVGGGGGGNGNDIQADNGSNGGSGGGSGENGTAGAGAGGQGTAGGTGFTGGNDNGGGGGGASSAGFNGGASANGIGGAGIVNYISGSSVAYGGGGGGGTDGGGISAGGTGGGGKGGGNNAGVATLPDPGTANTGGGGGGGGYDDFTPFPDGGAGGSGVVIISYPTNYVPITGTGTGNRLAKFSTTTVIVDALLSDDGANTTLASGNLFLPVNSIVDSITNGALNFGTTNSTTMTFGRSGQNIIMNSKVGISTTSPTANLEVNGNIFSNFINVLANGLGLDTYTPGVLSLGSTTATSIIIGRIGITTTVPGLLKVGTFGTVSNCNSTASPATCDSASSGSVAMATGGSTLVVNTTAVTANSQIFIQEDSSLGSRLGITCNTGTNRTYTVSARTAGTSFTITSTNNPVTNKACLSYFIVN